MLLAKAIGISRREAFMPALWAMLTTIGSMRATVPVLLTNAPMAEVTTITSAQQLVDLFNASTMSFTSQNIGARKTERIVPVLIACLSIVIAVGAILSGIAITFGEGLLGIYSSDAEVIQYGLQRLHVVCLTYFLCGMMDVACGSIRGMGYSMTPTIVSLTGACGLRILWIYTIFRMDHTLFNLYLSYPISWIVTFIAHIVCFIVFYRAWKNRTQGRMKVSRAALHSSR